MKRTARGVRTSHKGVFRLDSPGRFRVRGRHGLTTFDRRVRAATAAEAAKIRLRFLEELRDPSAFVKPSSVGELATNWLETKRTAKRPDGSPRLAPATLGKYETAIEQVIVPFLGRYRADRLTAQVIADWRDTLGQSYRAASVNGYLRILRTMLREAAGIETAGRVRALPEDDRRTTDDEPNRLTAPQAAALLRAAQGSEYYALLLALIVTAGRISTVLAARWEDLDTEAMTLTFRRRLSRGEVLEGVKRSRSARDVVPVSRSLVDALNAHRSTFNEAQRKSGLLFPSLEGGFHARTVLNKWLPKWKEAAGIEGRLSVHGLRRTATLLWREAAGAEVAKAVAGHLTTEMHLHYSGGPSNEEKGEGARRVALAVV